MAPNGGSLVGVEMKPLDVVFGPNRSLSFQIDEQSDSTTLVLGDFLETSEGELTPSFQKRISDFINASGTWFPRCVDRIQAEAPATESRLMRVYILSEQSERELVIGLSFRVGFDIEHGRGLKVDADDLRVIEYGASDIAFS